MITEVFWVPTLTTVEAKALIEQHLKSLPGICQAQGQLQGRRLIVSYTAPATEQLITTHLATLGYPLGEQESP